MSFTTLPAVTAGDFGKASWATLVKGDLDDHEAKIGLLTAPEANALLQAKLTGAAVATAADGYYPNVLITSKDDAQLQLAILCTDYSADVFDGFTVYQDTAGKVQLLAGQGAVGPIPITIALAPATGRIEFGGRLYHEPTLANADAGTSFMQEFISNITRTDRAAADQLYAGLRSTTNYGAGGAAVIGTAHAITADTVITGSGSADSEMAAFASTLRCDIGTGFTQTAGPVGRLWGWDFHLQGPKAVQPDLLNGLTILAENFFNGSPADSPSAALWLVSQITGARGTTYPIDVGLGIGGATGAAGATSAFTIGIDIGRLGSGWFESGTPKIGTGLRINNCSGPDIDLNGYIQGTEIVTPAAGAANSYRLFAKDNGSGKTQLMVIFASGAAQQIAIQP